MLFAGSEVLFTAETSAGLIFSVLAFLFCPIGTPLTHEKVHTLPDTLRVGTTCDKSCHTSNEIVVSFNNLVVGLFVLLLENGESILDGLFALLVWSNIPPTDDVLDGVCVPVWRVLKVRGGVRLDDDDSKNVGDFVESPGFVLVREVLAHKRNSVGDTLDGIVGHLD